MKNILKEYIQKLLEASSPYGGSYPQEGYKEATSDDLMLNEPGMIVEPDVRKKIKDFYIKMKLLKQ